MSRKVIVGIFAALMLIGAFTLGRSSQEPAENVVGNGISEESEQATVSAGAETVAPETAPSEEPSFATVIKVIDGDTISIEKDGVTETLRLIGINTPETVDPRKPVECFGKEASSKAKELLEGKHIRFEQDSSQDIRDKYGRTLAYVFRDDGLFFNKTMIEEGYAYEYTYEVPYKYQQEFKVAQKTAEANQKGLWAPGVCEKPAEAEKSSAVSVKTSPSQSPAPIPASGTYNCSSNTYNCTDFKTHAEAQAVYQACGGAGNDVHALDSDKDGDSCESLP